MYDVAVLNGSIVAEDRIYLGDIYINDGKIQRIVKEDSSTAKHSARELIDAKGKLVFPGVVDVHMHAGEYEADFEDMQTATMAAVAGGVTCCIDMPLNLYSSSIVNEELFEAKRWRLEEESYIDFGMWGALVPGNLSELKGLNDMGAAAFKCFLSGGGNDFLAPDIGTVREALKITSSFNGLAGFHCEDATITERERNYIRENKIDGRQAFLDSRPLVSELIATSNMLLLAQETKAKIHICHVTHPAVAKLIEEAKAAGVDVTAETCAHYLTFTENDYLEKGCLFGCAPPLRDEKAREGLWQYVEKGVLDFIVSDHSPGMAENRDDTKQPTYESGFGISGVQTMFQTVYDQAVNRRGYSPVLLASRMAANPARRFGVGKTKGAIEVGYDADMVILNPQQEWTIQANKLFYKQKVTAFDGLKGKGCVEKVLIRGVKVFADGKILVNKGFGNFVPPTREGE